MPQSYTPEFKKKIVRLHLEEGRTYKSITAEYGISKASISIWCAEFSEECQTKAALNPDLSNEMDLTHHHKNSNIYPVKFFGGLKGFDNINLGII